MGVMGTYCQLCGMPVQHDHYVKTERENYYAIYRQTNHPAGHFPLGPEHAWLLEAMAIGDGQAHQGLCEDGYIRTAQGNRCEVMDGYEEYSALHKACWEILGKPTDTGAVYFFGQRHDQLYRRQYHRQLFDFEKLVVDQRGWMLVDPNSEAGQANRERILAIAQAAEPMRGPKSVSDLWSSDRWNEKYIEKKRARYRIQLPKQLDRQGFSQSVWITFPPPEAMELEKLQQGFFQALHQQKLAVALSSIVDAKEVVWTVYAPAVEPVKTVLGGLAPSLTAEWDVQEDPDWADFYQNIQSQLEPSYDI